MAHQKKAKRLRAHLVFIDESGHLLLPHVAKTWGVRGVTPVLSCRGRHRQKVSVIGALTLSPVGRRVGLLWRTLAESSIDTARMLSFVRQVMRHLRGHVVIVWDNINTHRSLLMRDYARRHPRLHLEFLPPYAPELNPVEWLWKDAKCHALANHGLHAIEEVHARVIAHARRTRHNQPKLRGFIRSAHLPLRLPPRD